jgi:hypothetical protein
MKLKILKKNMIFVFVVAGMKEYQIYIHHYLISIKINCEGAFYYILKDIEYILDNIRLIIIENDYENHEHYIYVKNKLDKIFNCIEELPLNKPTWPAHCSNYFYQVWIKK